LISIGAGNIALSRDHARGFRLWAVGGWAERAFHARAEALAAPGDPAVAGRPIGGRVSMFRVWGSGAAAPPYRVAYFWTSPFARPWHRQGLGFRVWGFGFRGQLAAGRRTLRQAGRPPLQGCRWRQTGDGSQISGFEISEWAGMVRVVWRCGPRHGFLSAGMGKGTFRCVR